MSARTNVIGIALPYDVTPAGEGNELCGEAEGYDATANRRDENHGNKSGKS